jgi:hypothetical protein
MVSAAPSAIPEPSAPEVIWLQVDPEAEQFDGWEAQTWCSDRINETDVKYVRADLTPNVLADRRVGKQALYFLTALDTFEKEGK